MSDILSTVSAQLVLGITGLVILLTVGWYVVLKFRDNADDSETSDELLMKFREMRHAGHLDDTEYRKIKTDLESKLSQHSRMDDGPDSAIRQRDAGESTEHWADS